MPNERIKSEIKAAGLKFYEVAYKLKLNDGNFSRLLRQELPEQKKQEIRAVIAEIKEGEENANQ